VERKRLAGVHEAVDLVGKAAGLPAVERRLSLNFGLRVLRRAPAATAAVARLTERLALIRQGRGHGSGARTCHCG